MQAHIERLATFAQHGQPKDYAASDLMRADLEALVMQAIAQPAPQAAAVNLGEMVDAAMVVLDSAPCLCSHKRRYEDGEHLSSCWLFDLNLAAIASQKGLKWPHQCQSCPDLFQCL